MATATSAGGQKKDNSSGSNVDGQVNNQMTYGNNQAMNSGSSGSTGGAKAPSASTSDGSISLAGAIEVNVVNNQAMATIGNGLTIMAGGLLTVNSANTTGATSVADGSATGSGSAGIGVAVALNVATVVNKATIGTNDTISAGPRRDRANGRRHEPDAHHICDGDGRRWCRRRWSLESRRGRSSLRSTS